MIKGGNGVTRYDDPNKNIRFTIDDKSILFTYFENSKEYTLKNDASFDAFINRPYFIIFNDHYKFGEAIKNSGRLIGGICNFPGGRCDRKFTKEEVEDAWAVVNIYMKKETPSY